MKNIEKTVKAEYEVLRGRLSRNLALREEVEEAQKALHPWRQTKMDDAEFADYIADFCYTGKHKGVQSIFTTEGTSVEEHAAVLLRGSFERVATAAGGPFKRKQTVWQYAK